MSKAISASCDQLVVYLKKKPQLFLGNEMNFAQLIFLQVEGHFFTQMHRQLLHHDLAFLHQIQNG